MSPIWAALNKKLALFMSDYNGALKRHRCRRCRHKRVTMSALSVKERFSPFCLLLFWVLSQLFKQSARTWKIPAAPQVGPGRSDLYALIVNWSGVARALKRVHKLRSCCVFTENFNKTSLINFSVSIPNVDIFKLFTSL